MYNGTTTGGYVHGGVIYTAFALSGSGAISYASGVLVLPQPVSSGACVDGSPIGFGVDASATCSRKLDLTVTTGRSGCASGIRSAFDVSSFLEPSLLLRPTTEVYLNRTLSNETTDASTIPITCGTLTVRGLDGSEVVHDCSASGTVNATDFALDCSTTTNATITTVTQVSGVGTNTVVTQTAVGAVAFAVAEVHYTINRTTFGIVSAVASFVVIESIPNTLLPYDTPQTFSVLFVGGSSASGGPTFPRSGNPGYIVGKPVLAGQANATDSTVTISSSPDEWLFVPKAGNDAQCSSVDVAQLAARSAVNFGFDTVSGCALTVTVENFTDTAACTSLRAATLSVFEAAVNANNRVGIYGNADPTDLNDWVTVLDRESSSWGDVYSGTDSNYECAQVLVGLRLELLTAKVGSIDRAQKQN